MKKIFILFIFLLLTPFLKAQDASGTGSLIQGGLEDGNKLVKAYLAPLNKAILFGLGQQNYQGFRANDNHKWTFGIQSILLLAPPEEKVYDVNALGLQTLEASDPHHSIAQTVLGDSTKYIYIQSKKRDLLGRPLFKFKSPKGYGYPGVAVPYLNLSRRGTFSTYSIGFIPPAPVPTTGLTVYMLKVAMQWNLGGLLGLLNPEKTEWVVNFNYAYGHGYDKLNVKPGNVYTTVTVSGHLAGPYDNQKLLIDYHSIGLSSYLVGHLSEKWRLFAGGGMTGGISSIRMIGRYPIYKSDASGTFAIVAEDVDDPLNITTSAAQWFVEGGIRAEWKRFYLQLQGDYGLYYGGGLQLGYKFK